MLWTHAEVSSGGSSTSMSSFCSGNMCLSTGCGGQVEVLRQHSEVSTRQGSRPSSAPWRMGSFSAAGSTFSDNPSGHLAARSSVMMLMGYHTRKQMNLSSSNLGWCRMFSSSLNSYLLAGRMIGPSLYKSLMMKSILFQICQSQECPRNSPKLLEDTFPSKAQTHKSHSAEVAGSWMLSQHQVYWALDPALLW